MNHLPSNSWILSDATLRELLEGFLWRFCEPCRISSLSREPYAYRTSFPLEEVTVHLDQAPSLHLLCKCTSWESLTESAQRAKPRFLHHPFREAQTYRLLLADSNLGTPIYYGSRYDLEQRACWLFLEKVAGRELYQIGELDIWCEAARWLARFHSWTPLNGELRQLSQDAHLLKMDKVYFQHWLERALGFSLSGGEGAARSQGLQRLGGRFDDLLRRVEALPCCALHGEFYASNILVEQTAAGCRIAPVDWELAAIGPSLLDLAALVAGKWTLEQRERIVLAYRDALPKGSGWPVAPQEFTMALDACRLLLDVQWLGWSAEWSPPREHQQDWLAEALELVDRLDL